METPRRRFLAIHIAGSLALLVAGASGCVLDTAGKAPPVNCQGETAGINLRLTVNGPNSQANTSYQTTVTWKGEVVSPDPRNTCGNTDPFDITMTYSGVRDSSGDYTIEQPSTMQRPGVWKLTVSSMNSTSTCNQTLTAGNTKLVAFTHQQPGC